MPSAVNWRFGVIIPALLMIMSSLEVSLATSAAAFRTDSCDMRSNSTVCTLVFGYASLMDVRTVSTLEGVRDARIRRVGDCEAMLRAVVEPIPSRETPVMRTFA